MCDKPNRVIIEIDRTWHFKVRAERPDDVVVIFRDMVLAEDPNYKSRTFGNGELPILPLAVVADGLAVEYEVQT